PLLSTRTLFPYTTLFRSSAVRAPFVVNHRLVRGLDYYTRTAFEFTHGALGAQNAILGGGRYDGLSESLGGPQAPGIGFAIGEDRSEEHTSELQSLAYLVC